MPTFFHGWRRKTGVVMLVVACVFIAGWVRSLSYIDRITLSSEEKSWSEIVSGNGAVHWDTFYNGNPNLKDSRRIEYNMSSLLIDQGEWISHMDGSYLWQQNFCGIEISEAEVPQPGGCFFPSPYRDHAIGLKVPHWLIVGSLNLLSAWLLLSKPRKKLTGSS